LEGGERLVVEEIFARELEERHGLARDRRVLVAGERLERREHLAGARAGGVEGADQAVAERELLGDGEVRVALRAEPLEVGGREQEAVVAPGARVRHHPLGTAAPERERTLLR